MMCEAVHLCLEVIYHLFNTKGGVGKQADVVCNTTLARGDEVR